MTYTAAELLTVIAAVGVLLTGVGAVIVNIIVALRQGTKLDTSLQKTDGLVAQVQQVHTLTNSNLSAVKAELATATAQIAALRDLIQDLRSERDKTALAAALATPAPGAQTVGAQAAGLARIEATAAEMLAGVHDIADHGTAVARDVLGVTQAIQDRQQKGT